MQCVARLSLTAMLQLPARSVSRLLARYGQALYDNGYARYWYTLAVLAVADEDRSLRRELSAAWEVDWAWKSLTPAHSHIPMPLELLLALVSLALLWKWSGIATLLLLGFTGALRRGEIQPLSPQHVLLPQMLGVYSESFFMIRIFNPKMRRLAARMEHARVEEPGLLGWLSAVLEVWPASAPFFAGSPHQLTAALQALLAFFHVPSVDGLGITWASLRPGRATQLYMAGEPLQKIQWLCRWAASRTMDIYVQEVASLSVLRHVPPVARERVRLFAAAAEPLLLREAAALRSHRSPAVRSRSVPPRLA